MTRFLSLRPRCILWRKLNSTEFRETVRSQKSFESQSTAPQKNCQSMGIGDTLLKRYLLLLLLHYHTSCHAVPLTADLLSLEATKCTKLKFVSHFNGPDKFGKLGAIGSLVLGCGVCRDCDRRSLEWRTVKFNS
jgi:hypothetical protein